MAECQLTVLIVTGAVDSNVNGTYTKTAANEYTNSNGNRMTWGPGVGGVWQILPAPGFGFLPLYNKTGLTDDCPIGVTLDGIFGTIGSVLISAPSTQPTFGLPAESVALITSRFGTVANFLRLRNQGQV